MNCNGAQNMATNIWALDGSTEHPAQIVEDQERLEVGFIRIRWTTSGLIGEIEIDSMRAMDDGPGEKRLRPKKEIEEESDSKSLFSESDGESQGNIQATFPPVKKKKKTTTTEPPVAPAKSKGELQILNLSKEDFFLRFHFGTKLIMKVIKLPCSENPTLNVRTEFSGAWYHLVAVKYEKRPSGPVFQDTLHGPKGYLKAYYVSCPSLQEQLEKIANFSELRPTKIASRLELLVSPASSSKGMPRAWIRPIEEFEVIQDKNNLGCGFGPISFFEELSKDQATAAVQVRIVCPKLGVFKGMLIAKYGCTKVQLPSSMLKVGPSLTNSEDEGSKVYVLFNAIYPSINQKMMERQINPNLQKPPPSSVKGLRPLSPMIKNLLSSHGVPAEVLDQYAFESTGWARRTWTFCVGAADPTGFLPEGSIFITGMGGTQHQTFVTRCPCTEQADGLVLPVVVEKPAEMPAFEWAHLCSMRFGIVIFATPKSNALPLPVKISNGDLDGDMYFICWDGEILSYVNKDDSVTICAEDADTLSQEDFLIGQEVARLIDGEEVKGVTVATAHDDGYICDFGAYGHVTMSKMEVLDGRDLIDKIKSHRGKGYRVEVLILWELSKTESWERVDVLRRENDDNAAELAEYARVEKLLEYKGWMWAREYLRKPLVEECRSHRGRGISLRVEICWDDGEVSWELATELDKDVQCRAAVVEYAKEKGLLKRKDWFWAKQHLENQSKKWFKSVQMVLSDSQRLVEYSKLTESLHNAYIKRSKHGFDAKDQDTIALGRAFKQSLDICKHGGKVDLPFHLRKQIRDKSLQKHLQLTFT